MKRLISLILVCILLTACSSKFETITSNEAMELIDNGAVIIDVREVSEFNTGHIKGAINIPLGAINEIDIAKEKTIIVYCASGVRSMTAVNTLSDMGYTSLYNLDGGILNWGFELEE